MQCALFIGVDVAKDSVMVACSQASFAAHTVPNQLTALKAFLRTLPAQSSIAMEATGSYHQCLADRIVPGPVAAGRGLRDDDGAGLVTELGRGERAPAEDGDSDQGEYPGDTVFVSTSCHCVCPGRRSIVPVLPGLRGGRWTCATASTPGSRPTRSINCRWNSAPFWSS